MKFIKNILFLILTIINIVKSSSNNINSIILYNTESRTSNNCISFTVSSGLK